MTRHDLDLSSLYSKLDGGDNHFSVLADGMEQDEVVLRGAFNYLRLRAGLTLHTSDTVEMSDIVSRAEQQPGLTFLYISSGQVDVRFGERDFSFAANAGEPAAFIVNRARPDSFTRFTRRGAHVRKMVVTVSSEWLDGHGLAAVQDRGALKSLLGEHLASWRFSPPSRLRALVEQVIGPAPQEPSLQTLMLESKAIEIVVEMLDAAANASAAQPPLTGIELRRLAEASDFIEQNLNRIRSIDDLARDLGVSASSLQRLFNRGKGCSVFEFIRVRRMEAAMQALKETNLNVAQAAYIAGYSNPANFATAFRKHFGVTPSEARNR